MRGPAVVTFDGDPEFAVRSVQELAFYGRTAAAHDVEVSSVDGGPPVRVAGRGPDVGAVCACAAFGALLFAALVEALVAFVRKWKALDTFDPMSAFHKRQPYMEMRPLRQHDDRPPADREYREFSALVDKLVL